MLHKSSGYTRINIHHRDVHVSCSVLALDLLHYDSVGLGIPPNHPCSSPAVPISVSSQVASLPRSRPSVLLKQVARSEIAAQPVAMTDRQSTLPIGVALVEMKFLIDCFG